MRKVMFGIIGINRSNRFRVVFSFFCFIAAFISLVLIIQCSQFEVAQASSEVFVRGRRMTERTISSSTMPSVENSSHHLMVTTVLEFTYRNLDLPWYTRVFLKKGMRTQARGSWVEISEPIELFPVADWTWQARVESTTTDRDIGLSSHVEYVFEVQAPHQPIFTDRGNDAPLGFYSTPLPEPEAQLERRGLELHPLNVSNLKSADDYQQKRLAQDNAQTLAENVHQCSSLLLVPTRDPAAIERAIEEEFAVPQDRVAQLRTSQEVKDFAYMADLTAHTVAKFSLLSWLDRMTSSDRAQQIRGLQLLDAISKLNIPEVKSLIQNGARLNETYGPTQMFPLFKSVWGNMSSEELEKAVQLQGVLIRSGADPNWSPLHLKPSGFKEAAWGYDTLIRQMLYRLERNHSWSQLKEYLNKRASLTGYTKLIYAAAYGRNAVIELLLNAGADKNLRGVEDGMTAYDAAIKFNNKLRSHQLDADHTAEIPEDLLIRLLPD